LTPPGARTYHPPVLPDRALTLADRTSLAIAALALALGSCATTPPVASQANPQTPSIAPEQPPQATSVAPPSPTGGSEPATSIDAATAEEPITAAEIAAEPMPALPEPAPKSTDDADESPDATVELRPEYSDLWAHIRKGFVLADVDGPLVEAAEDWYAARPDYVARMVERSRRYLYYIVAEVEKRGMPLEIALLPMIESAYNPMALSRSRASGIWQFIPSTGKRYGMKQNWWFDERRDVVAATEGALDYLQSLYADFGDWFLALAAYNWGEGAVHRAIAANQKRGKPTDYFSLKMPAETRSYVPKLQAVKNIVSDPERFDLSLADIPDAPYFAVVRTNRPMDVKAAAELAEMPLDEFLSLNPQHNRPVIAGADEATLLLPYDKAELFAAKLELTNQPMVTWQAYKLKPHETLAQVAARFGLPLETLRAVNGIGPRAKVPPGHPLLVPTQAPSDATIAALQNTVFTSVPSGRTVYHRVRKGETLSSIAAHYDVSTHELKSWNAGLGAKVIPGQRLRVVSDARPVSKRAKRAPAHSSKPGTAAGRAGARQASSPAKALRPAPR